MKRNNLFFLFLLFSFVACKGKDKKAETTEASNPVNTARNFIRAALDGKYNEAQRYMLNDSDNVKFFEAARRGYENNSPEVKQEYRSSTIRIIDATTKLNDSTQVVIYSNTFKNDPDTLKVIKINGEWLVDFKYLYLHDMDTSHPKQLINDTIK